MDTDILWYDINNPRRNAWAVLGGGGGGLLVRSLGTNGWGFSVAAGGMNY